MLKKKQMYKPHKYTIITDANTFTSNSVRFLLYRSPNKDTNDGIVINLETGVTYPFSWDKYLQYFTDEDTKK